MNRIKEDIMVSIVAGLLTALTTFIIRRVIAHVEEVKM